MPSRRILLASLCGVRVKSQELLQLGMTLPGFVERSRVIASLPSLSLLVLAGCTPPPWEVECRDLDAITDAEVAAILRGGYDAVALTALSARILEVYALADRLRAEGMRVILGGLHVSALPQEAAAHADAVVQGEGEVVWPDLLRDLAAGRLRPLYSSFGPPACRFDFDAVPVPRYDLLDPQRYNRITLQTARGCPRACSFCAGSLRLGPYRLKSIPQVRRELEAILARWPRPFLELADDNTFVHKAWSKDLVRLLAEYPVKWFTETDLSVADDDELLDLLAAAHCAQVLIGLESAVPESLRGMDACDWKFRQFESFPRKIARIQAHGVSVNGCFILGLDSDDTTAFDRTRELVRACGLAEVQITVLTPFPGTDLYARLAAEGRLLKEVFWDECTLFDVTYRPRHMAVSELEEGFRGLMRDLYRADEVAARKHRFNECVRRRRGAGAPAEETR